MEEERRLTLGQYLRQERESRNISLESIAKASRITLRNLEALEKDEWENMPAPIFIRGFLRAYATHVGLDPREAIALYESQMELLGPSSNIRKAASPGKFSHPFKYAMLILVIGLGLGLTIYLVSSNAPAPPVSPAPVVPPSSPASPEPSRDPSLKSPPETPPPQAKVELPPAAIPKMNGAAEKVPVGVPGPAPSSAEPSSPAAPGPAGKEKEEKRHVLKIKASQMTWIRVQADGQEAKDFTLRPMDTVNLTARRQFDILIGNAGGVDIAFNGVPLGPIGEAGKVVRLVLPKPPSGTEPKKASE